MIQLLDVSDPALAEIGAKISFKDFTPRFGKKRFSPENRERGK